MIKYQLLSNLRIDDAFAQFNNSDLPAKVYGNNDTAFLQKVITKFKPRITFEIGSWLGSSTIAMAKQLKTLNQDAVIITTDTWLGGMEQKTSKDPVWGLDQYLKNGYPAVYEQFAANVLAADVSEYIIPIQNTSTIAARFLAKSGIKADMIYIDGSHHYEDVYSDLKNFYPLLSDDAVIWGDDWQIHAHGVVAAVTRFAHENNLEVVADYTYSKWFLQSR